MFKECKLPRRKTGGSILFWSDSMQQQLAGLETTQEMLLNASFCVELRNPSGKFHELSLKSARPTASLQRHANGTARLRIET